MEKYKITVKKSAAKGLADIPQKALRKIIKRIRSFAQNPRPAGSQKLSSQQYYRIRQGDYRIVYSLDDENLIVDIVKIGHRREIYRS